MLSLEYVTWLVVPFDDITWPVGRLLYHQKISKVL